MSNHTPGRKGRRALSLVAVAAASATALSGCANEASWRQGWLPAEPGTTNITDSVTNLWVSSWIAVLFVGALVWGLMIWSIIVYRKRKNDNELPVQIRYHLPLELLYTFVPMVMIGVLFFYTVQVQNEITDVSETPDVNIQVYAKQWSWDFNYTDEEVWDTGDMADLDGTMAPTEDLPTLYLPVGKRIEFDLTSRDVIHSFWVPAFLTKLDMFPLETRTMQIVPMKEGTYLGKCAELCGEFHAYMLFNVKVVSEQEYQDHIQSLRDAGQTGLLDDSLDRDTTAVWDELAEARES